MGGGGGARRQQWLLLCQLSLHTKLTVSSYSWPPLVRCFLTRCHDRPEKLQFTSIKIKHVEWPLVLAIRSDRTKQYKRVYTEFVRLGKTKLRKLIGVETSLAT